MKVDLTPSEAIMLLQILPIANQRLESFCVQPRTLKNKKIYANNVKVFKDHLNDVCAKIDVAYDVYIESEEYLNTL